MKIARLVVVGIALGSGLIAARLVNDNTKPLPAQSTAPEPPRYADVLVAGRNVRAGEALNESDFRWQEWPAVHVDGRYIRRAGRDDVAMRLAGSITRIGLVQGEPLRREALIDPAQTSYMAAMLKPGMRAVSADISAATGAGGFILPNDRVDIILVGNDKRSGSDAYWSKTILANIRVLAIDQSIKETAGQRAVIGKVGTFELNGEDAETLALAKRLGTIFLALRSAADSGQISTPQDDGKHSGQISFLRLGTGATR